MHDMHCHLAFMANGEEVAAEAQAAGTLLFANSVTPDEWEDARRRFAPYGNVAVGFGMHPWWVESDAKTAVELEQTAEGRDLGQRARRQRIADEAARCQNEGDEAAARQRDAVLRALEEHDPPFIGEVGLDFSWRHVASRTAQVALFDAVARWAAERGGKLLSLHSVHATAETLDVLRRTGALDACTCLFHWFTGPSDLLKRAVQAGCLFSVGPRMVVTGKGREYVKAIPASQLLLETDAPPEQGQLYSYAELRSELETAAAAIAAIKGEEALSVIEATSRALLS